MQDNDLETSKYYDASYFNVQKSVGISNADDIVHIFSPHIKSTDCVLDFGCGGGFLLNALSCQEKHGFDVNLVALDQVKQLGITAHNSLGDIENNKFDVIISNSALEHVPNPHECLKELKAKLKDGGIILFRVPHETVGWAYKEGDWNYHLFTWSPMAFGNLAHASGYQNISVAIEKGMSPPLSKYLFHIPLLGALSRKLYRILRLVIEELGIHRAGVDGYAILKATK